MKKRITRNLLILTACLCALPAAAQISSNPNKFLGNITTSYSVDAGGGVPQYYTLWNQITCENESKWSSVEGNRGNFNWGCDNAFNYAKNHNFTYKFHALVWGSQYPSWLESLTPKERYAAYINWYDHVKAKYKTLPMIDVVNEAVGSHQPGNPLIKASLGGGGKTGYDWLIKAFDMAYERWPDAILIYNDYNSIRWDLNNYITLVQTLRDAGAPIDAYGNQAHELKGISTTELNNALEQQQNSLKMPMFITEYDISSTDDNEQLKYYQEQIPIMWEKTYCAGVTLWGYVYGKTWTDDGKGYSGIYKDGEERLAMTWLREYMASDPAKLVSGPFPGAKKEASIYIRPAGMKVANGDVLPIKVHARLATKTIEKVDFYVNDELVKTMTEAPYIVEHIANKGGWNTTKAVVTATDGTTYERYGRFNVALGTKRSPYNDTPVQIPGTIKANEYDNGLAGVTYSSGVSRSNPMSTSDDRWMDYTVDVAEDGYYTFDAELASSNANGRFHLAEYGLDSLSFLTEFVEIPKTGSTSDFKTLHGKTLVPLTAGRHIISLMVEKGGFKIKSITLNRFVAGEGTCMVKAFNQEYGVGDNIEFTGMFTAKNSTIKEVRFYANNLLVGTVTEKPYTVNFVPSEMGTYSITAIVVNAEGKEKWSNPRELKVTSNTPTNIISTMTNDASNTADDRAYNLMGVPVSDDYRGIVIRNGKKVFKK